VAAKITQANCLSRTYMRAHGGLKEGRREIQRLFFLGLGRRNNDYGAAVASFAGFAFGTFGAR